MPDPQRDAWHALMDLHDKMPTGWALVGGQMVHLHCAERGVAPTRPTNDADAAVDVRADPRALATFTSVLRELGFEPAGTSPQGYQHRWVRQRAAIDVLIPRGLREASPVRLTVTGATTIETFGAQQAVDRAEGVGVTVEPREGRVRRPTLLGALVGKAAAMRILVDPRSSRHLHDFATLTTLIRPSDRIDTAGPRDREHLNNMLGLMTKDASWKSIDGAMDGVSRLKLALSRDEEASTHRRRSPWVR